jgi:hypothetical protein
VLILLSESSSVAKEERFFTSIKEDRGWYFVEYEPPNPSYRFATLSVVVPTAARALDVASAMEDELKAWLARYRVPLMVTAFDAKDQVFGLKGIRPADHLMGYVDATDELRSAWRLLNNELAADALNPTFLRKIYSDVPSKTSAELRAESNERKRRLQTGWVIVFVWLVVAPVLFAIFEYAGPEWVGAVILVYAIWQAAAKGLKMLGIWKKSTRELEQEREAARMRHHHYHCKQNPTAFERLKLENLERWAKERIEKEAASLKQKGQ